LAGEGPLKLLHSDICMNKISNYVADTRERAKRRRSKWNLLLIPFAIAGIGLSWYGLTRPLLMLRTFFFPHDAFLMNGTRLGNIVTYVAPGFSALGIGLVFANACIWMILPARRALDEEASGAKGVQFKASNVALLRFTGIVSAAALPLAVLGATSYFYLTPRYIAYRTSIFGQERHYVWQEVAKIETACWFSRGTPQDSYALVMQDGTRVGILESHPDFFRAYPMMASALIGHDFVFDPSGLEPGCESSLSPTWRALLTSKPSDSAREPQRTFVPPFGRQQ
jgi:hypothetical protein